MEQIKPYPCVVTIAGSDSSGGAGIQADIKTISATGSYAASVITALTAQNTCGVQAIADVAPTFIGAQLDAVFTDLTVHAVKIGMLHSTAVISVVAEKLSAFKIANIVLDPVMLAKSGHLLLQTQAIEALKTLLFPQVTLITPNIPEAEQLSGATITTARAMATIAQQLGEHHQVSVLIKGGHLVSERATDVLYSHLDQQLHWFEAERIHTHNTHGTGCTLSAAIASYLAQHYNLLDAITAAKNYLTRALCAGRNCRVGRGCGPVDHFYAQHEKS